jgi:hypothetical protein
MGAEARRYRREQYLWDLPDLLGQMPVVREYELAGHEADGGPALLTPESIQYESGEGPEAKRREAARAAKSMLCLLCK